VLGVAGVLRPWPRPTWLFAEHQHPQLLLPRMRRWTWACSA
jgi:hypothetical protein